jgi:hypothetical protein
MKKLTLKQEVATQTKEFLIKLDFETYARLVKAAHDASRSIRAQASHFIKVALKRITDTD